MSSSWNLVAKGGCALLSPVRALYQNVSCPADAVTAALASPTGKTGSESSPIRASKPAIAGAIAINKARAALRAMMDERP